MGELRRITERYRLDRRIGTSGSATVFQGAEIETGQPVAVKLLEEGGDSEAEQALYERYAEALRSLSHPGLPRLVDAGFTAAGSAYLVTDYLEGEPLAEAVGAPPARVLSLLLLAAEALEALADAGWAHGRVTLDNLFLVSEAVGEQVKLLGLGTAVFEPGIDLSPEGGYAADLKGLGLVACQLLRATPPEEGGSEVALPPEVAHGIDDVAGFSRVLGDALRGDPEGRLPSYRELRELLRRSLPDLGLRQPAERVPSGTSPGLSAPAATAAPAPGAGGWREVRLGPELAAFAGTGTVAEGSLPSETMILERLTDGPTPAAPPPPAAPAGTGVPEGTRILRLDEIAAGGPRREPLPGPRATTPPPPAAPQATVFDPPMPAMPPMPGTPSPLAATAPLFRPREEPSPEAPAEGGTRRIPFSELAIAREAPARPPVVSAPAEPVAAPPVVAAPPPPPVIVAPPPPPAAPEPPAQAAVPPVPSAPLAATVPVPVAAPAPTQKAPRPANPAGRRRTLWIAGSAAAALLVVAGIGGVVLATRQPAPPPKNRVVVIPKPVVAPRPAPVPQPPAPPPVHPQIVLAENLLASGDLVGAKRTLEAIPAAEQARFSPEETDRYQKVLTPVAQVEAQQKFGHLSDDLKAGDLKAVKADVAALTPDQEATLPADAKQDLKRAQKLLEADTRLSRAERGRDPQAVIRLAGALLADLPRYPRAVQLREKAATEMESEADQKLQSGDLDGALARLQQLRDAWPDRPRLGERIDRVQSEKRADQALEEKLAAATRAEKQGKPLDGLAALKGAEPNARYADRFRQAKERLEAQFKALDSKPPEIAPGLSLKDFKYAKGATIKVPLRVTDDYEVKSVDAWARPKDGSYVHLSVRQVSGADYELDIEPSLHDNKEVEFYVTATDRSGHEGHLGTARSPQQIKRKWWPF